MPDKKISKNTVLLVACLSSFLTPFTSSSVNIALPSIDKELSLSAVDLSWIATAYLLSAAVFLVPFGRIADIYGRKKIFTIGIIINAVASLACLAVQSGTWLILLRAFQGFGAALTFGTGVAILLSVFPPNERGKVLGFNVASVYTGLSIGPITGGFLTHSIGWRSIFLLNALIGIIVVIAVLSKLKGEWQESEGEKFDLPGSIFYSVALVILVYGFSQLPDIKGYILVAGGVTGTIGFVAWELRQKYPVFKIDLFRSNKIFAFSNIAALVNYCATFAVSFLLSLYLQYIFGYSADKAGLVMIIQPVVMVIVSLFAGNLSDKLEPRVLASAGMTITTLGLVMLSFLSENSNVLYLITILVIMGIGFGLFSSPNTNAAMSAVERKYYGVASGMLGTMRLLGQTFSLATAMLLIALFIGDSQIIKEVYPLFLKSMRIAFIIFAVMCFLGIFASAVRGKSHKNEH